MDRCFKNHNWIITLVIIIIVSQPLLAVELEGTPHDLSSKKGGAQICQACHVGSNSGSQKDTLLSLEEQSARIQEMVGLSSSLLCAQCHDSTISHRNIINAGELSTDTMNYSQTGSSGRGNHPVNMKYPTSQKEFKVNPNVKLYGSNNNQIKCNTCHDPHKAGNGSFLRKKNGLCKDCHLR